MDRCSAALRIDRVQAFDFFLFRQTESAFFAGRDAGRGTLVSVATRLNEPAAAN